MQRPPRPDWENSCPYIVWSRYRRHLVRSCLAPGPRCVVLFLYSWVSRRIKKGKFWWCRFIHVTIRPARHCKLGHISARCAPPTLYWRRWLTAKLNHCSNWRKVLTQQRQSACSSSLTAVLALKQLPPSNIYDIIPVQQGSFSGLLFGENMFIDFCSGQ